MKFGVIILAAGIGKRMHSKLPKVLHPMCGKPMLWYVAQTASSMKPSKLVVVVGKNFLNSQLSTINSQLLEYVVQDPPLGTGDAVVKCNPIFNNFHCNNFHCNIFVLCGDVPLLKTETLKTLMKFHTSKKASATILTADVPNPEMYGRIIRNGDKVTKIVEDRDASASEKKISEINSGIYAFESSTLFSALKKIKPLNAQNEYYLTDTIEIIEKDGKSIYGLKTKDYKEIMGINTREMLSESETILQTQIISRHQLNGVTFSLPQSVKVDFDVRIGKDSIIHSGVQLLGNTKIGEKCEIGANTIIVNSKISSKSKIGDNVSIENVSF